MFRDFNTFMYNHTLHRGKKQFCHYFLQAFITAETLKCHIQDYFKINGKQRIEMTAKGAYVKFKNYESKIRLPFLSMQILKVC